uniref:Uncharacterized protein n=1 Tax=Triticum urartu TaxID=4572 RepID=A0A8R7Q9H6_TRIUA
MASAHPCLAYRRKKIASSILRPQGNSRADRQWKLHHPAPAGFGGRRTMIHQGHRREVRRLFAGRLVSVCWLPWGRQCRHFGGAYCWQVRAAHWRFGSA